MSKFKSLLLLFSSAFLIASCSSDVSDESKSSEETSDTTVTNSSGSQDETSSGDGDKGDETQLKSFTVKTNDWSFENGVQFDNGEHASNLQLLLNYMNSNGENNGNIVESIEAVSIGSKGVREEPNVNSLGIGSGKTTGSMTLNFNTKVYKVELEATTYYSDYSYTNTKGRSIDANSELKISNSENANLETLDLKPTETDASTGFKIPLTKTSILKFDNGTSDYKLETVNSTNGRVIINYFTFYYK